MLAILLLTSISLLWGLLLETTIFFYGSHESRKQDQAEQDILLVWRRPQLQKSHDSYDFVPEKKIFQWDTTAMQMKIRWAVDGLFVLLTSNLDPPSE